ncbi:MAG: hypothetical protein NW224_29620 [Leptolyngbyaceae cyanobacterium bins.302]|nr:hypothetical protein [Leptolyngbyaceae cyanobacterium bins.302]
MELIQPPQYIHCYKQNLQNIAPKLAEDSGKQLHFHLQKTLVVVCLQSQSLYEEIGKVKTDLTKRDTRKLDLEASGGSFIGASKEEVGAIEEIIKNAK